VMSPTFTAVLVDGEEGWIVAYVEEMSGVHGQGRTEDEALKSLRQALQMVIEDSRARARDAFRDARVIRRLRVTVEPTPLQQLTKSQH
jgi:predicted RNase H-like HicB family nuclease